MRLTCSCGATMELRDDFAGAIEARRWSDDHAICRTQSTELRRLRTDLAAARALLPAQPIGYISKTTLKNLTDPQWQELRNTPADLWTVDQPPSRAIIPVYVAPQANEPEQCDPKVDTSYTGQIATLRADLAAARALLQEAISRVNTHAFSSADRLADRIEAFLAEEKK